MKKEYDLINDIIRSINAEGEYRVIEGDAIKIREGVTDVYRFSDEMRQEENENNDEQIIFPS